MCTLICEGIGVFIVVESLPLLLGLQVFSLSEFSWAYFAGSFPYRNPFGYHQAWRARHFLIYAIMGGKQSFIKVVSLPYSFSLNAVSFMVTSGSSASPTTSSGSSASLTPSSGSSAYLTPSALMPSASWWRQDRQLTLPLQP